MKSPYSIAKKYTSGGDSGIVTARCSPALPPQPAVFFSDRTMTTQDPPHQNTSPRPNQYTASHSTNTRSVRVRTPPEEQTYGSRQSGVSPCGGRQRTGRCLSLKNSHTRGAPAKAVIGPLPPRRDFEPGHPWAPAESTTNSVAAPPLVAA